MSEPALRVEGARQLRSTMRRAGADMRDLTAVNREVADIVAGAGKGSTPYRTGRLAGTVRPGATQTMALARAGGARTPYANPIHWGWYRRGIKPQPWLSQAAQSTEPIWFARFEAGISRLLDKIKGV